LIDRPQQACCGIMLAIAGSCGLTPLVSPQLDPDVDMSHSISQADAIDERDRSITVNRLVNVTRNLMNLVSTLSLFDAKTMRNANREGLGVFFSSELSPPTRRYSAAVSVFRGACNGMYGS